jgi:acetolactate synthase I/II/III large subunit
MGTVGQLIVESLVANGIDRLFCVPGESYLGLLDALYGRTDIDTVACRHEAGAGFRRSPMHGSLDGPVSSA